jgi:Mg2+ and Co2+ transporter CorA
MRWEWSYPAVLILMFAVAGAMFIFFKIKKWL